MDKETIYIKNLLVDLDKKSNEEKLRINLYTIMITAILSKKIFVKNSDIPEFISKLNIHYKDYVYRSRTLVVARIIREIEKSDKTKLLVFVSELKELLFESNNSSNHDNKKKLQTKGTNNNSADDILSQFRRE
ncbi:hypothetical protein [Carnobacterium antarcticum]|uniref:Uncharacterized protein n=1 Tax=Carnobacterium antarcticum TaxID=2126436 RepID=A0ABW4NPK3_9LACT|nr:hypothetical protein [Carnobacterium sp. CP1]